MKRIISILGLLLTLLIGYLLFWPVSFPFYAWEPPAEPSLTDGPYTANEVLKGLDLFATQPFGLGPEDVAVDTNGLIYVGLLNGKILRYQANGSNPAVFADTKGRPLGLHFDKSMNLIVADAQKGLLSVSPAGAITALTKGLQGYDYVFTDDLDIAADGKIYFSDASSMASTHNYMDDIMAHCPCGKLLVYDPGTRETTLLLDSLHFANGIAVSPDQSFVLVNETTRYRVLKYWLSGPKQGIWEVLIDNLPGFPDGISTGTNGIFWVALANPRNPQLDALLPNIFARKIVHRLPSRVRPQPVRYSLILGINAAGEVIHNLQDPDGGFAPITSVQEANGMLYVGSLTDPAWARMPLP